MCNVRRLSYLVVVSLFVSFGWTSLVYGEVLGQGEVGITFNSGVDETPPPPQDNTITASKQAVNKRVPLPQTGELVRQLSLFITGIILVVIVFAYALDQQVKGADY